MLRGFTNSFKIARPTNPLFQIRGGGALVERPSASPAMHASRIRVFQRNILIPNVTRRSRRWWPRQVKVEIMQCIDGNFAARSVKSIVLFVIITGYNFVREELSTFQKM